MPTSSQPAAVTATALHKRFGDVVALDGLDLHVAPGTVLGLLGPNGAGKTTAVRILATLLAPDSGSATVGGADVCRDRAAVRSQIGLTGQFTGLDDAATGRENLVLVARLLGHDRGAAATRAGELLDAFGLTDAADRRVRTWSGGMRRRLDIALGLVVTPAVLFLDEPTTGLDPASRNRVWTVVRELAARGTTVVLTTQYLAEAEALADRVAVLDGGRKIAEGTVDELRGRLGTGRARLRLADAGTAERAARLLRRRFGDAAVTAGAPAAGSPEDLAGPAGGDPGARAGTAATLHVRAADASAVLDAVGALRAEGMEIVAADVGPPSLDDVFLALTGHRPPADEAPAEPAGSPS